MDKQTLITKKNEAEAEFAELQTQRQNLIRQLTEVDAAINRTQGQYNAYDSLVKEIEATPEPE